MQYWGVFTKQNNKQQFHISKCNKMMGNKTNYNYKFEEKYEYEIIERIVGRLSSVMYVVYLFNCLYLISYTNPFLQNNFSVNLLNNFQMYNDCG